MLRNFPTTHTTRLATKRPNSFKKPMFNGSCALKLENEAESPLFSDQTNLQNAIGNRTSKNVGNTTTFYLTDENNPTRYSQVVEEYTQIGNGQPTLATVYAYGFDLISKRDVGSGDVKYYGYDGNGSVRFLTDNSGNRTDNYDYDAFGILINSNGATRNNYLYAGEQFDFDLGLYYNRARYLDVDRGRFRTMDPFGGIRENPRTLNDYLYALNDPVMI